MINSSKWLFLLLLVDLNVFVHSNADKSHTLLNDWQSYLQNHSKEPKQNAMQILARVNRYLQQNAQDQNIRHLQCKIFHYLGKSDSLLVYGKRFLDHWPHSECSEEIRYDLFDLFCKRNQHDLAQAMMTKLRMRRWRYSALMTLERAAKGASQDSITAIRLGAESLWLNSCFDTLCLPGIDGNKVQLTQFNSPCVLITWAPWCELTRAKLPAIKRLQHALQNQPITWIFLAFDSTPQEVKTFLSTTPLQGVHTVQGEKYAGHLGLEGFPLYAVFNRQGVLIDKSVSGSARRVLYEWYLYGLLKIMHNCDTSPRWFELKGDHALALKDTLSAIAFYQQSLEQNPRHIELGRKLLEIYKQKQLIDSAQRLAIANADILLEDQEFALTIDPGYLQFQLHVLLSFFARFPLHQAELYDQLDSLYHITESLLIPPKSVKQDCRKQLFEKKDKWLNSLVWICNSTDTLVGAVIIDNHTVLSPHLSPKDSVCFIISGKPIKAVPQNTSNIASGQIWTSQEALNKTFIETAHLESLDSNAWVIAIYPRAGKVRFQILQIHRDQDNTFTCKKTFETPGLCLNAKGQLCGITNGNKILSLKINGLANNNKKGEIK